MAKTSWQREDEKRKARLEEMRDKIASGELTVRQMTPEERERWNSQSAATEALLPAEERTRRNAALKKRARVQDLRRRRNDNAT